MHDLLHDPLISIRAEGGIERVSLPELLARLCAGRVEAYAGLRAHQADPWHVFLVQIAASVLARQPQTDPTQPPMDAAFWRGGLLDLAEGCATAWELVVEDLTQPAFMQHPLPGAAIELATKFAVYARHPDELDTLLTAKSHDIKQSRAQSDSAEQWLYALMTNQTTRGYSIRYRGIVRMNKGTGSRVVVSLTSSREVCARFREEVSLALECRAQVLNGLYGYTAQGTVLTWAKPWSRGDSQWFLPQLEPFFVETAQPTRLTLSHGCLTAHSASQYARQIGPSSIESGDVGDPWTPLRLGTDGASAMRISEAGWTPELLTRLLFDRGTFQVTAMQRVRPGSDDLWLLCSGIARDPVKTRTTGFHSMGLRVPGKARLTLLKAPAAESLGAFGLELIKDRRNAERALQAALFALAEGGPEKVDFDRKGLAAWVTQASQGFNTQWTERYFEALWQAIELSQRAAVRADWRARLVAEVRQVLRDAESRLPLPVGRRWRALTRANWVLTGALKKAELLPPTHQEQATEEEVRA